MTPNVWKYVIAGFPVEVVGSTARSPFYRIRAFELFSTPDSNLAPVLSYHTDAPSEQIAKFSESIETGKCLYDFEFEGIVCSFYRIGDHLVFRMLSPGSPAHIFYTEDASDGTGVRRLRVFSNWEQNRDITLLRFSMWMAFGLAIAPLKAFPIHSSVNVHDGQAYLFLGESGTGKSTHTRLWRENIPGCILLNDDSPIVRVEEGKVFVYGSPWSGKTPCYRNEKYPVRAVVRLSQAPYNKARRLLTISALSAVYPSCPPAFASDEVLSDLICATLSSILTEVPVFHLECLPDAAAVNEIKNAIDSYKKQ